MGAYLDYKSGMEEEWIVEIGELGFLTVVLYGPEYSDIGFVQNSRTSKSNQFEGPSDMSLAFAYQTAELVPKKTLKGHHPDLDYEWNEDLPSDVN